MKKLGEFCTCRDLKCPLHPTKHDKGCTPCISKNLRAKEIPSCFFNLVDNAENRDGYAFKDFAELVLKNS
nr:DUF6485 family protein [Sedimentibacter sp.]